MLWLFADRGIHRSGSPCANGGYVGARFSRSGLLSRPKTSEGGCVQTRPQLQRLEGLDELRETGLVPEVELELAG